MSDSNSDRKGLLKNIVDGAKSVTGLASSSLSGAADAVARTLPDARSIKQGVGRALIVGGRTLIDPKVVVGEFAVQMGERLAAAAPDDDWLALAAVDDGFAVLARGPESDVRTAIEGARAEGASVLLCRVVAAHAGASGR
ncbi:hypothetical protein HLB44_25250 [Aquincola sp. S2]|uniref:Uncharacterized protein n=1 Tax=Pseudaquabacterium terrae TaxID=2732868 RepID=A0ABX2ENP5_9BURK|nr:hypothetical protein [Aquabacterium terrae]NRF70320.1 hypothetical protein [Aquabacterium terrae]